MVSGSCLNAKTDDSEDAIILFRYILRVDKMSEDNCISDNRDLTKLMIVKDILNDVINAALLEAELGTSANNNQRDIHKGNKFTSIIVQDWDHDNYPVECQNSYVGILNSSYDEKPFPGEDEGKNTSLSPNMVEHKVTKPKKKKKLSFSSIFSFNKTKIKNQKVEEDREDYDTFSHTLPDFHAQPLSKSRKFSSAVELRTNPAHTKSEKPSILRRLASISDESTSFLRRSLSFRDVRKKDKRTSREVVAEKKVLEWRQSLQSLVENDFSVSYNDLSFINYDALNEFNYKEPVQLKPGRTESNFVLRTQSLREKVSFTCFYEAKFFPLWQYLPLSNEKKSETRFLIHGFLLQPF